MNREHPRKTAVAYLRVSSEEQVETLSLPSQESKIRGWCETRGYDIIALFSDEGESAYNDDPAKRPQFASLLEQLPRLRPDIVVVFSIDRWARSTVVSSQTFRLMADLEIGFASVTESIWDLSDPSSRLLLGNLAAFAEYSSAQTGIHVRRVSDLKFERGFHRGQVPFGYRPDAESTRLNPRAPVPDEKEFPIVQELFQRAATGSETCHTLANWLNGMGLSTRNRKRSVLEEQNGASASGRRFTRDSVHGLLTNRFYVGKIVRQRRNRAGTPASEPDTQQGLHHAATSEEMFARVQEILRSHYKAPRTSSNHLRTYLAKGLVRCAFCGEIAWCHWINGNAYYQESTRQRGMTCVACGKYWPTGVIDHQIEGLIKPIELPDGWKERSLQLANRENGVLDLRLRRRWLEDKRGRLNYLFKEGQMEKAQYRQEIQSVENELRTIAPADVTVAELAIADFEHFGETWDASTLAERAEMLRSMIRSIYVNFLTGQLLEIVPKPGFRYVLESSGLTRPLAFSASGTELTIGDPDGIRTHDLHRDRVAC